MYMYMYSSLEFISSEMTATLCTATCTCMAIVISGIFIIKWYTTARPNSTNATQGDDDRAERNHSGNSSSSNSSSNNSNTPWGTNNNPSVPVSVNYHLTRQCNYTCGFCFHTAKTSAVLPMDYAKRGLQMLKEAGMQKVNFSGGEPFIVERGKFVGELVKFCKVDLQLPSVTIVSNGSLIKEKWFKNYGEHLDILAISCDSFDPQVNKNIGRYQGKKDHLESLHRVRELCHKYKVAFKINSVVNTYNKNEDMAEEITALNPCRWKVFQCLLIGGENSGESALRQAESYIITPEEFQAFLDRHKHVECLVPESNEKMQNSYLILDEFMRFLDCTRGSKDPSKSILDVGVYEALKFSGFDEKMFHKRGGKYKWSKGDIELDW